MRTKLVPRETHPPKAPFIRRHSPPSYANYRTYRPCLRWEFGFQCAFCLVHEADLFTHGIEGTGLTSIEHFEPKSLHSSRINDYSNLYYACVFCNRAKSDATAAGLLDPSRDTWGNYFRRVGDQIQPISSNDQRAICTSDAYSINDAVRRRMREDRREAFDLYVRLLGSGPEILRGIQRQIDSLWPDKSTPITPDVAREIEAERKKYDDLAKVLDRGMQTIERWRAIPEDCDDPCRCACERSLPPPIAEQCWEYEPPYPPRAPVTMAT